MSLWKKTLHAFLIVCHVRTSSSTIERGLHYNSTSHSVPSLVRYCPFFPVRYFTINRDWNIHAHSWGLGLMVLNATFNNISAISWWSALLMAETGAPGENHQPAASHWQTLSSHNVVSSTPRLDGIVPSWQMCAIYKRKQLIRVRN